MGAQSRGHRHSASASLEKGGEAGRSLSVGGKQSLNYPNCRGLSSLLLQAAGIKLSYASQLCSRVLN